MSKPLDLADGTVPATSDSGPLGLPPSETQPAAELSRPLSDFVKLQVGKRTLPSVADEIRRCMLVEAVRRTGGNITRTACILGLTRQAVQQMLSNLQLKDWASRLREVARSVDPSL
jgi:transcriptional regulator with GAF, ATPase, and Fis domain